MARRTVEHVRCVQRLPTIDQWNATIQRQITPTLNITASYIGNKGTHVFAGGGSIL